MERDVFVSIDKQAGKSGRERASTTAAAGAPSSTDTPRDGQGDGRFSIVGIGASAGGLEAFEQFFRDVPVDSGMAFVLVQHLDPEHASLLTEILQRSTAMPVIEATDQLPVLRDHVYVIPPNRDMVIFHGALQLSVPDQRRGLRMPIDLFLRSLAEDQGERAIGIILSGTGTDGTLGLRAIVGAGGITLAQDPATARYDGMPNSAIRAGYASQVLAVEHMPKALAAGRHLRGPWPEAAAAPAVGALKRILMLLRSATGNDFSLYKKSTIGRRVERRMAQHDIADMEVYVRFLKDNPAELQALFKELLINVTTFFRDPEAFVVFKRDILPLLFADKPAGYVFRIWVAGCASGEEAYSVAMLLREFMDETEREFRIQLYATDLDDDAIAVARAGVYPPNIAQDVPVDRLRRFFVKDDAGYRVKKEIREMVVFAVQNVIKDPPFTKLDLLCCRNLMIYLEPELQARLIPTFHYALKPGGMLFLSPSESIGNHTELFAAQNRKWKFYRAIHTAVSTRALITGGLSWAADNRAKGATDVMKKAREINFAELTRRVLLQCYAPASVVTDHKGNILYVYGDTGKYLRPAPGQATLNVVEMAREALQLELRGAILHATAEGVPTLGREVLVSSGAGVQPVSFNLRPLPDPDLGETLLLISFEEPARPEPGAARRGRRKSAPAEVAKIEALERELAYTQESLQTTIEDQQASNEEMQATNEELQSTNEELETSREELQSINEELVTVNTELQAKIEQLAGMQNDMKNLLDNVSVGTIFLDEHLIIRRFTREAAKVYRLIASDVGRPLGDIKSDLENEDLLAQAQNVLDSLIPYESELRTGNGAWYLTRMQPYRTLDNVIEGVVLTFTDISKRVEAEAAVQAARELAEGIVNTVRDALLVLDGALKVVSASRSFYRTFRVTPAETLGRRIYDLGNRQWDIPSLRELLETILPRDQSFDTYPVEHTFPTIGRRRMLLNASRIVGKGGDTQLILLAMQDTGSPP